LLTIKTFLEVDILEPHSPSWYKQLAKTQQGYYYPWKSALSPFNGEDAYLELVKAHLQPHLDVLDAGCGHGEVALEIAPFCQSVLAYDLVEDYIELARIEAEKRGLKNAQFICANSSATANHGQPKIPARDNSIDLFISRRGPFHWLADAKRVAKPGATIIMLTMLETALPAWHDLLPDNLSFPFPTSGSMLAEVQRRLETSGFSLHSHWTFDVPEVFENPKDLHTYLTWANFVNAPPFETTKLVLETIFEQYASNQGLAIPHRRLLWKAVVS
jgi:ubiquinone/menaquinone biosynthesis C-methylase UbiE